MKSVNPITYGAACAAGVVLSNFVTGGADWTGAVLAGAATGVIVTLILFIWQKRRS